MLAEPSQELTRVAHVLVVDDDGHIREVVRYALEKAGHKVFEAADGAAALRVVREQRIDLVVLDIIMPEQDGLEVCRRLRTEGGLPIVFLTSRDEELDRVLGLELGADDYVTKPFSPRELVARVKAVLRRSAPRPEQAVEVVSRGPLRLDPDRHECSWAGQRIELTVKEFALLHALAGMRGKVYTRDELVERAYGLGHAITDRTIDSHIRRVRKKLGQAGADDPIETVYGLGYRLRELD
ncbi:MAG: response regulator transcription factor [Deltaproteobacteria bacterium]|nr:response regulator transcription factor [Deltaproteobacteria bacterium]